MYSLNSLGSGRSAKRGFTVDPGDPAHLLKQFDPTPGPKVLKKMNFYFKPYSRSRDMFRAKHMTFDHEVKNA